MEERDEESVDVPNEIWTVKRGSGKAKKSSGDVLDDGLGVSGGGSRPPAEDVFAVQRSLGKKGVGRGGVKASVGEGEVVFLGNKWDSMMNDFTYS